MHVFTKTNMCHPSRPSLIGAQKATLQPPRQKFFAVQAGQKVLPFHTARAAAIHTMLQNCGFSAALSKQLLDAHPTSVRWDVEADLRPAVVAWQHELGLQQMATTWQAVPGLLSYPTSKLHELCAWLTSLGVQDPKEYVLRSTWLLTADINTLQEKAAAVFAWAQMPPADVAVFLHRHTRVLSRASETTKRRIELVASVLDLPVNSPQVAKLLSSASRNIFSVKTSTLEKSIAYLDGLGLSTSAKVKALHNGTYCWPVPVLEARAQRLACKLGWSQNILGEKINSLPVLLCYTPQRLDANLDSLKVLGFSSEEAIDMAARRPFLLTANWGTKLRQDKWHFISAVVMLSRSTICANPGLLGASLKNKLVPRWHFLCDLASKGALTHNDPVYFLGSSTHMNQSDRHFARQFDKPQLKLVYGEAYKQTSWDRYIKEQLLLQ